MKKSALITRWKSRLALNALAAIISSAIITPTWAGFCGETNADCGRRHDADCCSGYTCSSDNKCETSD